MVKVLQILFKFCHAQLQENFRSYFLLILIKQLDQVPREGWWVVTAMVVMRYTEKALEVYHRSACRVISDCLANTPVPLLLLKSVRPLPLKIVPEHLMASGDWGLRRQTHTFLLAPTQCRRQSIQSRGANS